MNDRESKAAGESRARALQPAASNPHLALVRRNGSRCNTNEGRFASTVLPDKPEDLPATDLDVNVVDGSYARIGLGDSTQRKRAIGSIGTLHVRRFHDGR